jgi:hypothetical protein
VKIHALRSPCGTRRKAVALVHAVERPVARRADRDVQARDPAILELVAVGRPELDLPQIAGERHLPPGQDGGVVPGIEILVARASREGQLVGRVLPDREGEADALLEYLELGPLLPHPLIGIVGLAEVAAELDLAEGGREPLFLRDGHRRDQNRQGRPEDECQQAANLSHWPPCH